MSIFDRLFRKKPHEPKAGSREAKERFDKALDQLIRVAGRAKLSSSGYPICPSCGQEFPVPAKTMQTQSEGVPVFACPGCSTMIRL